MSIFKCKMCGGTLEISPNETVATCEYCGTQQTLPKLDDERRANLYDRANHFRRNNEFDKAMGIYEKILNEDNSDAEAYWSLVLCRYGIEYVEDPATHKRVPTVNRAQFTSIFDDDNYKSALKYADSLQRSVYEAEANTINEIQKGILAISEKEDPFDVFICYKESDSNGRRTPDSVLANELYHELKNEGFKVFFSRITLEDKLGTAYEPYIFAALNSAKVMVVLGTKPEYFNAVWVKNEWSRYLALIKTGQKKILIPAYKDMDPYDLPEEFSHLQAQDMTKLGFMQDLIRGIKKITQVDAPKITVVKEAVTTEALSANTASLLKRAFMFLEDRDWKQANAYCEKVLDLEPENAQAYLGKMMADRHASRFEDIGDVSVTLAQNANYKKVMRFGDEKLKSELQAILDRNDKQYEQNRLKERYQKALDLMNSVYPPKSIEDAEKLKDFAKDFEALGDYQDAKALAEKCVNTAQKFIYDIAASKLEMARLAKESSYFEDAAKLYEMVPDYQDATEKARMCQSESICASAISLMDTSSIDNIGNAMQLSEPIRNYHNECYIDNIDKAIRLLEPIRDYHDEWCDASELLENCHNKRKKILQAQEKEQLEQKQREQQKKVEEKAAAQKRKKQMLMVAIVVIVAAVAAIVNFVVIPGNKYKNGVALMESGDYSGAIDEFEKTGGYRDSSDLIINCRFQVALDYISAQDYDSAIAELEILEGSINDDTDMTNECKYQKAIVLSLKGEFDAARKIFKTLSGYKDSAEKITEMNYQSALAMMEVGNYEAAISAFKSTNGYKDSALKIQECTNIPKEAEYNSAVEAMNEGKYVDAYQAFMSIADYKDSKEKAASIYDKYMSEQMKNAPIGSTITFGSYEQDGNSKNGKEGIEWIILERKDNKLFVISKSILDVAPFNDSWVDSITWAKSSLRTWLNNDFYNNAFTSSEKAKISTTTVVAEKSPKYDTPAGANTQDKVFLLSVSEAETYFGKNAPCGDGSCEMTAWSRYKLSRLNYVSKSWWLRTPGQNKQKIAYYIGDVTIESGSDFDFSTTGVRPAMWINLNN